MKRERERHQLKYMCCNEYITWLCCYLTPVTFKFLNRQLTICLYVILDAYIHSGSIKTP